jgi:hypothetical protein
MLDDEVRRIQDALETALNRECTGEVSFTSEKEGDTHVISIRRKPAGEPVWYAGETGLYVDWKEKFAREEKEIYPPFQEGDQVKVTGFIEPDRQGLYRIHVDADGRIADNFFVGEVLSPDPLQGHVGMPLEVILKVGQERKQNYRISDIWNYDAQLLAIVAAPPINPDPRTLDAIPAGKRAIIDGKFMGYSKSLQDKFLESLGFPDGSSFGGHSSVGRVVTLTVHLPDGKTQERTVNNPPQGFNDTTITGKIETAEGTVYDILMPNGRVTFTGGVLENLERKKSPMPGDHVRIAPMKLKTGILRLYSSEPCYLVQPSTERLDAYNALRHRTEEDITSLFQRVDNAGYAEARTAIGTLRSHDLTAEELRIIRDVIALLPEKERPVQVPQSESNPEGERTFWTKAIDEAYQVTLESMTKDEFTAFAARAVSGDLHKIGKDADTSYLFGLARDFGISKETQEYLMTTCIDTRLPKVRGIPWRQVAFDDKYNLDQSLKYLAGIGTESAANRIFALVRDFEENGDYHKEGWRDHRDTTPEDLLYAAVSAIRSVMSRMPKEVLKREEPYLIQLQGRLSQDAEAAFTVRDISGIIHYIQNDFKWD